MFQADHDKVLVSRLHVLLHFAYNATLHVHIENALRYRGNETQSKGNHAFLVFCMFLFSGETSSNRRLERPHSFYHRINNGELDWAKVISRVKLGEIAKFFVGDGKITKFQK